MKNIKKIIMVLLVAVLSLCGLSNVSAAGNGSITVNNAVNGKTYEIYKIFDLTYSGTETKKVAYTIDSDWEAFFKGEGASYIVSENTGSLNPITVKAEGNTNETKYINITEDNVAEFTQKALAYAANLTENDGSQVAAGETVEFTNLDLGYYLVYPQGATDIKDGYASICSITSTLPNAEVNVKAKDPEITKDVNEHSFDVGEYAQFTIIGQVPNTTGFDKYDYIISDTWTAGLELDETKVNFTVTIDGTEVDVEPVYSENGFTLTFDMTDYQEKVGKEIKVTYQLKITEDAINSDTTQNSATLTYSNNPKDDESKTTTPPQIEKVYSSKIVVTKVDGTNNEVKLAGATFILKGAEGYYQAVMDREKLVEVKWVEKEANATPYTTDETGEITFEGLKNGKYELIETEAPAGYNKLPESVKVTVSGSYNKDEATGENILDEPIPVVTNTTVLNYTGTRLPSTGGVGTTLFIVVGSLLMIGSLLVLITNKRMSKESL